MESNNKDINSDTVTIEAGGGRVEKLGAADLPQSPVEALFKELKSCFPSNVRRSREENVAWTSFNEKRGSLNELETLVNLLAPSYRLPFQAVIAAIQAATKPLPSIEEFKNKLASRLIRCMCGKQENFLRACSNVAGLFQRNDARNHNPGDFCVIASKDGKNSLGPKLTTIHELCFKARFSKKQFAIFSRLVEHCPGLHFLQECIAFVTREKYLKVKGKKVAIQQMEDDFPDLYVFIYLPRATGLINVNFTINANGAHCRFTNFEVSEGEEVLQLKSTIPDQGYISAEHSPRKSEG